MKCDITDFETTSFVVIFDVSYVFCVHLTKSKLMECSFDIWNSRSSNMMKSPMNCCLVASVLLLRKFFFFLLMHTTGITCDFGPQRALLHMSFDEERPMNSAFDLSRFCGRAFITAWTSIQRLKVAYTLGLSMHGVHCLQSDVLSVVITPTPTSGDVWASTPPGRTR